MQDVIDLQVKAEPHGFVLTLLGQKFLCDSLAELQLGELPNLGALLWAIGYPFELVYAFHPGERQKSEVGRLEEIVDDESCWGVANGKAMARVDCKGATKAVFAASKVTSTMSLRTSVMCLGW